MEDLLKFKLGSKLMKGVFTGILKKQIKNKFDVDADIKINDLDVSIENGKAHIHVDIDGDLGGDDIIKLMKSFM